jgi:hypothetical protein
MRRVGLMIEPTRSNRVSCCSCASKREFLYCVIAQVPNLTDADPENQENESVNFSLATCSSNYYQCSVPV